MTMTSPVAITVAELDGDDVRTATRFRFRFRNGDVIHSKRRRGRRLGCSRGRSRTASWYSSSSCRRSSRSRLSHPVKNIRHRTRRRGSRGIRSAPVQVGRFGQETVKTLGKRIGPCQQSFSGRIHGPPVVVPTQAIARPTAFERWKIMKNGRRVSRSVIAAIGPVKMTEILLLMRRLLLWLLMTSS